MFKQQKPQTAKRKIQTSLDLILGQAALPLFFHPNAEVSVNTLKALYAAGIRAVEYTNRGKEALQNFKVMMVVRDFEFKDMQLGIGTIKNEVDAKLYIEAGADFIISPGLVPEVVREVDRAKLLWIPGCMTVSEIIAAENMGAKLVKIFPGNLLGTSYISTIKDIFPDIYFMPTGGLELSEESIKKCFDAGVAVVGLGSKLITPALLEQKKYDVIKEAAREVLNVVQRIKKNNTI